MQHDGSVNITGSLWNHTVQHGPFKEHLFVKAHKLIHECCSYWLEITVEHYDWLAGAVTHRSAV